MTALACANTRAIIKIKIIAAQNIIAIPGSGGLKVTQEIATSQYVWNGAKNVTIMVNMVKLAKSSTKIINATAAIINILLTKKAIKYTITAPLLLCL